MWVAAVTFRCEVGEGFEGKIFFADTEVQCAKQVARYLLDEEVMRYDEFVDMILLREDFVPFEAVREAANVTIEELLSWDRIFQSVSDSLQLRITVCEKL